MFPGRRGARSSYGVGRRRPDVVVAVGVLAWVLASALGPGVVVMIDLHVAAAVGAEGRGWATAWRSGAARRRGDWISTALAARAGAGCGAAVAAAAAAVAAAAKLYIIVDVNQD